MSDGSDQIDRLEANVALRRQGGSGLARRAGRGARRAEGAGAKPAAPQEEPRERQPCHRAGRRREPEGAQRRAAPRPRGLSARHRATRWPPQTPGAARSRSRSRSGPSCSSPRPSRSRGQLVSVADVLLVIFVSLFSVAVLLPVVAVMERRFGWSRGTCAGVLVLVLVIVARRRVAGARAGDERLGASPQPRPAADRGQGQAQRCGQRHQRRQPLARHAAPARR